MCGIAGKVSLAGNPVSAIESGILKHRGPDSFGVWSSEDKLVWLAHNRLAIVDLSESGAQPMIDPETGNCIVFNGEIYNNFELRSALIAAGADFRGTSDTESILVGFRIWGESVLERMNGMFSLAIYSAAKKSVWLARDRFGIKPLYICHSPGSALYFASEVRWIRQYLPDIRHPTKDSIAAYLQSGVSPHNELLFPDVEEFPVASAEWIGPNGREGARRYWKPLLNPRFAPPSFSAACKQIRQRLETSVGEHLMADVPIASLLSGGIDSSIVTGLAARRMPGKIHTFSVGFREAELDETKYAKMVAERFETEHHHIQLDEEEVLENVREAVGVMDLPTVDAINTYIVVRQVAKEGYKVVLSGLGGDEIFGGYPQFRELPRLKYLSFVPKLLRESLVLLGKARHLLRDVPKYPDAGLFDLWWRRVWGGYMLERYGLPVPPLSLNSPPSGADDFVRISWAEISHYMRDTLLRDADVMSMAVSIEMRVPFLDHRLVEYALNVPTAFKLSPKENKHLLVKSCEDFLPPDVYQRPKMGFVLPMDRWMNGPLRKFTDDGIEFAGQYLGMPGGLRREIKGLVGSRRMHWSRVWAFAVLGHKLQEIEAAEPHTFESERSKKPSTSDLVISQTIRSVRTVARGLQSRRSLPQQRFLVPVSAGMGDFLMATPFYENLHRQAGPSCIDFLVYTSWPAEELLKHYPFTGRIVRTGRKTWNKQTFSVIVRTLASQYSACFLPFDASPGAAYATMVAQRSPRIIGHTLEQIGVPKSWVEALFSDPVRVRMNASSTELYLDLINPLFRPDASIGRFLPSPDVPEVFSRFGVQEKKYVVVQPGAANGLVSPKIWPLQNFIELSIRLAKRGIRVVALGSKSEMPAAAELAAKAPVVNLVGQTNMLEMITLIRHARSVVSHDSGIVHVADSVGTPFVVIFGPSDLKRVAPINGIVLRDETLACIGCRSQFSMTEEDVLLRCPYSFRCMSSVSVDRVEDNLLKILEVTGD